MRKRVRLTKYAFNEDSETVFLNADFELEENHPNGFNVGTVREGIISEEPTVGKPLWVSGDRLGKLFRTSEIIEVFGNGFKTLNSYYRLEILEDLEDGS